MESSSSGQTTKEHPIIAFYRGEPDRERRTLNQILEWDDEDLEYNHDYIQILFPLPESSGINTLAPVINREVFDAFRADSKLRDQLHRSFKRLAEFYGFKVLKGTEVPLNMRLYGPWNQGEGDRELNPEEEYVITLPLGDFNIKSEKWLKEFDHNHLRITRIIRSLRILGLEDDAIKFHDKVMRCVCFLEQGQVVSSKSKSYWDRAIRWPMNLAPDALDLSLTSGPDFLVEHEASLPEEKKGKVLFVSFN